MRVLSAVVTWAVTELGQTVSYCKFIHSPSFIVPLICWRPPVLPDWISGWWWCWFSIIIVIRIRIQVWIKMWQWIWLVLHAGSSWRINGSWWWQPWSLLCVPDASYTSLTSCTCEVISCLVALIVFPLVFVIVSYHWLVVVRYISLFSKPARKQTKQLYIVLHAQQEHAMRKLVTAIK